MTDRREGSSTPAWRNRDGDGGQLEDAQNYIERLGDCPTDEAVPKLLEIMGDESWFLRERAGKVLVGYGREIALPVEGLLKDGLWYTRAAAIRVLGRIGEPRSLRKVIRYLDDSNRTVAEETAKALLDFCNNNRSLAIAKIFHSRGTESREKFLSILRRIDPDSTERLNYLMESSEMMGPEGRLEPSEEDRLIMEVNDNDWGISWRLIESSRPLPEPPKDLFTFLRGSNDS